MPKLVDMTGKTFGLWKVLERGPNTDSGKVRWRCICTGCGREFLRDSYSIRQGDTKGCNRCARRTHGMSNSRLYRIWHNMVTRTTCKTKKSYNCYGGKGIKVCDDWKKFDNFKNWALVTGYDDNLTIERIDNNSDYCPENCTWIPFHEQNLNRRWENKTGFVGIFLIDKKSSVPYQARRGNKHIGRYATPIEAAFARDFYLFDNNLLHRYKGNFLINKTLEYKEIQK